MSVDELIKKGRYKKFLGITPEGRQEEFIIVPSGDGETSEIGVAGTKMRNGFVYDEFDPELRGKKGRETYRAMLDTDSTIGAVAKAITLVLTKPDWKVVPNELDTAGEGSQFLEECLKDMEHSFKDAVKNASTFLWFGFSLLEPVYKLRAGESDDIKLDSMYNDGNIGVRKFAPRAQETIERWRIDEDGCITDVEQRDPNTYKEYIIPMQRLLHFRTDTSKNSPEGKSVLRPAYRPYYFIKRIQEIEAIGIERNLNGLPVVYVPAEIFDDEEALADYVAMSKDVKMNEQGGIVLSSETYKNADGTPSSVRKYEVQLLSSQGSKTADTGPVIVRYQKEECRLLMAGFLMLGDGASGSFALSSSQIDFFLEVCNSDLDVIEDILNRQFIKRLWKLNGFKPETMPTFKHDRIEKADLAELGGFLTALTTAGIQVAGDLETENTLLRAANLPEKLEATSQHLTEPLPDGAEIDPVTGEVIPPPTKTEGDNQDENSSSQQTEEDKRKRKKTGKNK